MSSLLAGAKHPTGRDDLLAPADVSRLSGLDFSEAMLRGELLEPPIGRTMNFRLDEVSEGRAVFRGKATFDHYNPFGTVHGGWFGALLDSCMGCAVHSTLPAGKGFTTLEYKVNLIRPVSDATGVVLAIGEVRHAGRRSAVADGRIVGADDGKLYATGSTTCLVMDVG